MPKLSVIVPVYNTEKYLRQCIDSILSQIFSDFELILVDDGSTDKSGVICDEYSCKDNRIRVIHQENDGVTAARKRGVETATGEYISFIDSDDWIEPNMYQDMLMQADSYNADMILCDMVVEQPGKNIVIHSCDLTGLFTSEQLNQQIYPTMLFDFEKNKPGLSLCLCNKLFKSCLAKPVFAEVPKDIIYGEDKLGSLLCLLRSNCVFIMDGCAFYHYRHTHEFFMRERRASLLPCLSNFAKNTELQLSKMGFAGTDQLPGYIAQASLYCVRQILLFNAEYTASQKLGLIRDYFEQPHIRALLARAEHLVTQKKLKQKILLVNRKHFFLLFVLFCAKESVLRVKKHLLRK